MASKSLRKRWEANLHHIMRDERYDEKAFAANWETGSHTRTSASESLEKEFTAVRCIPLDLVLTPNSRRLRVEFTNRGDSVLSLTAGTAFG